MFTQVTLTVAKRLWSPENIMTATTRLSCAIHGVAVAHERVRVM